MKEQNRVTSWIRKDRTIIRRVIPLLCMELLMMSRNAGSQVSLPGRSQVDTTLYRVLNHRLSQREFQMKEIGIEKLSWLLWAAGKAAPEMGKTRKVIVIVDNGRFEYNALNHTLTPSEQAIPELRIFPAPVHLYLLPGSDNIPEDDSLGLWRGRTGQALYLGANALGLGVVTIGGVGFPIGYPESERPLVPRTADSLLALPSPGMGFSASVTRLIETEPLKQSASPDGKDWMDLLWSAYGYSVYKDGDRVHRTVPSARGRYPMEVFTVFPGMCGKYDPAGHKIDTLLAGDLRQAFAGANRSSWMENSPGFFIISWDTLKMQNRGSAMWESGAMMYNLDLTARSLGLDLKQSALSDPDSMRSLLGLAGSGNRIPLFAVGLAGEEPGSRTGALYHDGVYTAMSTVWPEVKVEVTVLNSRISQIRILEDKGTPGFSEKAVSEIPDAIVGKGVPDVDCVSGATLSSTSIIQAVKAALQSSAIK